MTHIAIDYDYWPAMHRDVSVKIARQETVERHALRFSTMQIGSHFGPLQLVVTQHNRLAGLGLGLGLGLGKTPTKRETLDQFLSAFQPMRHCEEASFWQQLINIFLEQEAVCVPLTLIGTAFQHQVWRALMSVGAGETCSYQQLGQQLTPPKPARPVGQAVGANPVSLIVPCHRVLASDGTLGGYRWGVDLKKQILAAERAS